eukprot:CAMPEP_0202891752 /NCGR_PEP_ID=MMETSP1392-20130828/1740_1 /ASSEMBLY_ACC=CAM_ASM_000868 /TAXON_ID=225041 /ORGANISM="Chlamydomonas chlamydogama, Strain SAG 11-48b" /LENGTH=137 /DNA_ID=CAMNT_0049575605 /DNA_START=140 /DNA_END=553 /DNA_ORIENTATION=-
MHRALALLVILSLVISGQTSTDPVVEAAKIAAEAARFGSVVHGFAAILILAGFVCVGLGLGNIALAIRGLHQDVRASMEAARNIVAAHVDPHVAWVRGHKVQVAFTDVCSVLGVFTLARFGAALGLAMVSKSHRPGL